ncbi:MAG: TatD family hydrolase [Sterolibacteriaceae bacterium]|nr:TatD family hydrolase [Candidatus Methylophosphatis haderslevensis]
MYVDSHCHLDLPEFSGRIGDVLAAMRASRVSHALCISVNLEHWPAVLALAEAHGNLWATVGKHPDQVDGYEPDVAELVRLAQHPRIVAIGETGLDYYWQKDAPQWQRERFRTHIRAAREAGLPLVVHTREAAADTIRLMREEGAGQAGGVMHCFSETQEVAEQALELGFYISFSGIVTFKNALALKQVAQAVPLDRLLIETDAPYLAPMPYRGRTNQPAYVVHVAEEIARLRQVPLETVAAASSENFFRLFAKADS